MKLVLLTGFLGAGKTTFLEHLLKEFQDQKIGVLMNEFGEESIDGKLIKGTEFDLLELTNGSIFCACLKENFIKGLAHFLTCDLEYVFVESSGVSDPSNMTTVLETVEKISKDRYDYLGAVCIVDGLYFEKQYACIPAVKRQILYSNAVIINKSDLQEGAVLDRIEETIQSINPEIICVRTAFCEVSLKTLLTSIHQNTAQPEDSTNTWESRPKSVMLSTEAVLDYQKLGAFLHQIKAETHRIKGFARTSAGDVMISCVNDFAVMTPWDKPLDKTEIVIIASVGIKIISTIQTVWTKYFGQTEKELY